MSNWQIGEFESGKIQRRIYSEAGLIYTDFEPFVLLEAGDVVSIEDFHDAARTVRSSKAWGTQTFRDVVANLAPDTEPFNELHDYRREMGPMYKQSKIGFKINLHNFYIPTQQLHDHLQIGPEELKSLYRNVGPIIIKAVLEDTAEEYYGDEMLSRESTL